MATVSATPLELLFEQDETAWLEAMALLASEGRLSELDLRNLSEYLADMVKRDRREVTSRLSVLITHWLKWRHQPERRSASWRGTVEAQRQELEKLFESDTLRLHALETLAKAYRNGIRQAAAETELDESLFPAECPFTLDELLVAELLS